MFEITLTPALSHEYVGEGGKRLLRFPALIHIARRFIEIDLTLGAGIVAARRLHRAGGVEAGGAGVFAAVVNGVAFDARRACRV